MSKAVKRGFVPSDDVEFSEKAVKTLCTAGNDLKYLINRGYHLKSASVFVGNHFMLSERQRLALARGISSDNSIKCRKEKEITTGFENKIIHIDGFNTIITLEVAFSDSLLLKCMDGTIRDLAALRGTYRLIDKTDDAIESIGKQLEHNKIDKAVFYLDAPVSNSGRLKVRILDILSRYNFDVEVEVINNVDSVLSELDYVVTSDAIILDKCISWINLTEKIIKEEKGNYDYIDLSLNQSAY
ncbi:MAG: DUF434 domain-containing protein [Lachnospiraceae bacterium]|nr:DUF434 domain-containing protein [Lachnospiraceae bacterium]MDE6254408.1 DUF434 domain-containing protein [Lachnospiraceae bacterium]